MNAIIDDILGYHYDARFDLLKPQALRYAFERTPKTSRLRKLLLHIAYYEGTSEFLQANFCASQHPDVIIDLGKLLAKHGGVMKPDGTRDFEKVSWPYDCEEPSVCKCYHVHRKPLVQREKKAASAADVLGGNRSAV